MNTLPFDAAHCSTLVELLRFRAAKEPDKVAYTFLVDGDRQEIPMTYAELDRQARKIAGRLQALGAAGERALLLYPPGLEYITAFFGCLYAGVTAMPAFPPRPNRPMPRLQGMVADARVKVAMASSPVLDNLEQRFTHAPELRELCWLNTDHLSDDFEMQWKEPAISKNSLAFLQYTSGSTSIPKGVMLTHGNLLHNLELIRRAFECSADTNSVFWLPPYHDMGLIGGILEPLYSGGSTVLMAPVAFLQSPFRWLDAISRTRAVISGAPNFAYDLCVQKITPEQQSRLDLSSWQLAFNGAEPVRADTLDRFVERFSAWGFRKEAFYPCYGLAEATLFVTGGVRSAAPVLRSFDARALEQNQVREEAGPGGKTFVGSGQCPKEQRVVIVHPETCLPCPAGEVGEIWVEGGSVAQGYWNRPEESERTFRARLADDQPGAFLRTGDLGFLADGELFVTGRAKDLIILQGKNHYPQDIEQTVEESSRAVRPSCVAAFAAQIDGEEKLIVVAEIEREARGQNQDDTLAGIRRAVAAHHDVAVSSIVLIKTLTIPKTSSGKIQRHLCRERFLAGSLEIVAQWKQEPVAIEAPMATPIAFSAPSIPGEGEPETSSTPSQQDIQTWLVEHIAERLKFPAREIDVNMPFSSLGMDSMTAVLLAGDLETYLGRSLPPTLMYDHPSIAALAENLANPEVEGLEEAPKVQQRIDRTTAQGLLERLDDLPEEDAGALLAEMLAEEEFRTGGCLQGVGS
jgi:acyl-CoA synthetase (AMP-forming)/AMP-acid ligase II/acyl carrier protein